MTEASPYVVRPPVPQDAEVLGNGAAYLWVAKGNERAIRFYQRHGFAADGAENVDRDDGITEIRMVRRP